MVTRQAHRARRFVWWRTCIAHAGAPELLEIQRLLVERARELGMSEELARARLEAAGKVPA
jgi:hypothetical protein